MTSPERRIGPAGTAARAIVALVLLYLAGGADGLSWRPEWHDAALGLVAFPAVTLVAGLAARRRGAGPVRFTGPLGHAVNCAAIVVLLTSSYTAGGTMLFYATTLLLAAWRGLPGCEITVLPNWLLRRDDQVGCPLFWPIDATESKERSRTRASSST